MSDEEFYQDDIEVLDDDGTGAEVQTDELSYEPSEEVDAQGEPDPAGHHLEAEASPLAGEPLIDPLDELPLALTVRCGGFELSLGDLRCLGPGCIIEVIDTKPGHATLCHGNRVVAEGELVDIDGRLGLQITRMAIR